MAGRKLTPTEQRGWARVTQSIRPLNGVQIQAPEQADLESEIESLKAAPKHGVRAPIRTEPSKPVSRPAIPAALRDRERRVRRGQLEIDAYIDLHGLTQSQADRRLPAFLLNQRRNGARCVLVITGKGRGGEGILRRNFLDWLTSGRASDQVSGYATAHIRHGGSGAFYVFLRRL
ncbi:MAG: Smr/MutS family protein [Pseudomonadota bacterium]